MRPAGLPTFTVCLRWWVQVLADGWTSHTLHPWFKCLSPTLVSTYWNEVSLRKDTLNMQDRVYPGPGLRPRCFKLDIITVVVVFSLACSADRQHIIIPVSLSAQNSATFFRIWVLGLERILVQTALLYFPFVCILFLLSPPPSQSDNIQT